MNLQVTNREMPGLICHFARRDVKKGSDTLTEWARDQWSGMEKGKADSEPAMNKALALAAAQLKLTPATAPERTLNGLTQQSFDTTRLVAIPALNGMTGVAVFALTQDQPAQVFKLNSSGQLETLELASLPQAKGDVRAMDGKTVIVALNPKKLDLVVSDYTNQETQRICSYNRPDQKVTFTHMSQDHLQAKIANNVLYQGTVFSGTEQLRLEKVEDGYNASYSPGGYWSSAY